MTTSAYEQFRRTRTFSAFDGLRGLLSILIVWCHSTQWHAHYKYGLASLSTFFLISGFLITTLLLRERDRHGEISLKMFYARRTLRIFPLYYTVIAGYVALVAVFEPSASRQAEFFGNLKYYLTYSSNWFVNENPDQGVIFFFAWSLATEEQFYLLWPWIERYFKGWIPVAGALTLIAIDQAVTMGYLTGVLSPASLPHRIIASVSTPICMGVILAHILHHPRGYAAIASALGRKWSSLATLAAAVIGAKWLYADEASWWAKLGEEAILFFFVAACVVREDHWLGRVLAWKPATRLGVISYGTYLMHMIAVNAARIIVRKLHVGPEESTAFRIAVFAVGYPLAITAAAISYRYYEGVFLKLKTKFERVPKPPASRPMAGEPPPALAAESAQETAAGKGK